MFGQSTIFFAFALAQPADLATADSRSTTYFPANLFLVRATNIDLKKAAPPTEVGTFVITHVYAGDGALKGKKFECTTSFAGAAPTGGWDGNYRHVHHLEKDAEGLWWLYLDPKDKKLRPELRGDVVDAYWIRIFPITNGKYVNSGIGLRRDPNAEWRRGLAWAEGVESVFKAKSDEERAVILRRLAETEQSPVAGWAINLLGKVNPKGAAAFLKTLVANDKLSVESHVALDQTLSRLDYPRWRSSDHWEPLLVRWVNSADLTYYNAGMARLRDAKRKGEVDFGMYVKILAPVLARADRLKNGYEEALGRALSFPPFQDGEQGRWLDWLAGYVRHGKTEFVRAEAAAGMGSMGRLSPDQLKAVRALRDESTERQVRKALDDILERRWPR